MTIYNVTQRVVELVEADSEDEAQALLRGALDDAGFEPLIPDEDANRAFESESVPDGTQVLRRVDGHRPRFKRDAVRGV